MEPIAVEACRQLNADWSEAVLPPSRWVLPHPLLLSALGTELPSDIADSI